MVPTSEAFAPPPTVGLPLARTGGQARAQAPLHALFVPLSFLNRYTVRPFESTRIFPRPVVATPTVAGPPLAVLGGAGDASLAAAAATACDRQRGEQDRRRGGEEGD